MTKVNYLNDLANMNNLFFMALTETHLSHNILDAEININDFNILRQDRQNRSHGGVLLYIRKNTVTNTLSSNSNQFCDYLLVEIPKYSLIIGVVYRPPNCPKTKFIPQMADISQKVNNFQRQKGVHYNFLLMGDFNFPFVKNWNCSNNFTGSQDEEKIQSVCLSNFSEEHLLMQMVDAPTRGKNTLDLIFSNSEELVTNNKTIVNENISDHNSVVFGLGLKNHNYDKISKKEVDIQSLNAFDFVNASEEVWTKTNTDFKNVNWELEFENQSSEESLDFVMEKVQTTTENNFSIKGDIKTKTQFKNNNKIPKDVRNWFRQKGKLSKKVLNAKNPKTIEHARSEIGKIDNKLRDSYAKWNLTRENKVVENLKVDPKSFYKFANSKSNVKTGIGPLEKSKNTYTNDPLEMASLLNKQYSGVFGQPAPALQVQDTSSSFSKKSGDGFLSDIVIS